MWRFFCILFVSVIISSFRQYYMHLINCDVSILVSILTYIVCMGGTFHVCSSDKCYSLIAAVDLTACRGSHDGYHTQAGIKSLQSSHSQLTSILCPVVSFKPLEPHEQGITHWDPWIIWMEWLSDSDTVGNEDEMGSTCLKLMGMDCVRGDVEPHLPEAAAGARTWTVSLLNCSSTGRWMPAPPTGYYTCDWTRGGQESKDQDSMVQRLR